MRVVIGEDHALLRDGLTRILQAHSMDVMSAVDNATELDVALGDDSIDVAVLDVRMPPTFTDEGLRAAIKIRASRPGFPVLDPSGWGVVSLRGCGRARRRARSRAGWRARRRWSRRARDGA